VPRALFAEILRRSDPDTGSARGGAGRRTRPGSILATTQEGGAWRDVAMPETSVRAEVRAAWQAYEKALTKQKLA
jgi:hypothetical protein